MASQFRNTKRTIREPNKRKTKRTVDFFRGGEFKFPENAGIIRQFFRDFYSSVFTTKYTINSKLLNKVINPDYTNHHIVPLFQNLQMDPQALSMNLAFMIYTYNNKSYYKFIKRYFNIDIQTPTKKIMRFLWKGSSPSKGGGKSTAIIPKGAIEISYKVICITSLMYFLYFSTLFYYSQRIFTETLDKNMAVLFLKNTGDFLSNCKFSEARYKPKSKIEAMIQNLFRPLLQNPNNIKNFEGLMYLIKDCLSDPADDFRNKVIFDFYAKPEIVKLEEFYGIPRLEAPTATSALKSAQVDIILSTTRESTVISPPSSRELPSRTWITATDDDRALVPVESTTSSAASVAVSEIVPELLQKTPDFFKQMVTTMKSDINGIRDPDALIKYFDRMSSISEEDFDRLLGSEDSSLFNFQGLSSMFSDMKDMKDFMGFFVSGEMLNKFMLYQSGASISKIVYIDFKKNMRQMTNFLKRKAIDTEEAFHNIVDDSVLLLEYMRVNWINIYNILGSFLTFIFASFQIFRQYIAFMRSRSRLAIEDV